MKDYFPPFKTPLRCGCRGSTLSLIQTKWAIKRLQDEVPFLDTWEIKTYLSPGDRDLTMDLRESPPDFFSRDLDMAILDGHIDCALHSAKDMPEDMPDGIDYFWLPWHEDRRDTLVLRSGFDEARLHENGGCVGISSQRRENWLKKTYPAAEIRPIRGNIEERIKQLDDGGFDALIMPIAALNRLCISDRIVRPIPLSELDTPAGQGCLGLAFSRGNRLFELLRAYLFPPVRFVGAGAGEAGWITLNGLDALKTADICLYDALVDTALLDYLPLECQRVFVGKRMGMPSKSQAEICRLIADHARRGWSVLRLKGGDPGVFGRLQEELATLDKFGIVHRVYPGMSSLTLASTGTGFLLTGREVSRGFRVLTPIRNDDRTQDVFPANQDMSVALFMSLSEIAAAKKHFLQEGFSKDTPCAIVYQAGTAWQEIRQMPLDELDLLNGYQGRPALILINPAEKFPYRCGGPLGGIRVLLTCSMDLMTAAKQGVEDAGGTAIPFGLIKQEIISGALPDSKEIAKYDWLILSSPASIRLFMREMMQKGVDLRTLPKIMVSGVSSAKSLQAYGIVADLYPEDRDGKIGADAMLDLAKKNMFSGQHILRLRSDKAGHGMSEQLAELGCHVTDREFYKTVLRTDIEECPPFDAVFFASSSAVEAYKNIWGTQNLGNKPILIFGDPTRKALENCGISNILTSKVPDARQAMRTLSLEFFYRKVIQFGIS